MIVFYYFVEKRSFGENKLKKEAKQARLNLHLSKFHIGGNHMSRLKCNLGQCTRFLYLLHHRAAKANACLHICVVCIDMPRPLSNPAGLERL